MGTGRAVDIEVGALMVRHCGISVIARALAPVVVLTTACGAAAGAPSGSPTPSATLAPAPAQMPPPSLTQQKVDAALSKLDGFVRDAMSRTGVPGVSVAVVYKDRVVYLCRRLVKTDPRALRES